MSEAHEELKRFALFLIAIWPVGLPLVLSGLLYASRDAIYEPNRAEAKITPSYRRAKKLANATDFLHEAYIPAFYMWDVLDQSRKVVLVGWLVLLPGDQTNYIRLLIALLISLLFLIMHLFVEPYEKYSDTVFATVCQLILCLTFVGAILIRAFEDLRLHAGDDVARRTMGFESPDVFSAILAASAFSMIVFLAMMALYYSSASRSVANRLRNRFGSLQRLVSRTRKRDRPRGASQASRPACLDGSGHVEGRVEGRGEVEEKAQLSGKIFGCQGR